MPFFDWLDQSFGARIYEIDITKITRLCTQMHGVVLEGEGEERASSRLANGG